MTPVNRVQSRTLAHLDRCHDSLGMSACRRESSRHARHGRIWEFWLDRIYRLRRDKRQLHERPHKPVLLLSLIDMLDSGLVSENALPLSEDLIHAFKR